MRMTMFAPTRVYSFTQTEAYPILNTSLFCSLPLLRLLSFLLFFFNDTATTEIYTLSLHDALPISTRLPAKSGSASLPAALALQRCHGCEGLRSPPRNHGAGQCRRRRCWPAPRVGSIHSSGPSDFLQVAGVVDISTKTLRQKDGHRVEALDEANRVSLGVIVGEDGQTPCS